jgi:tetratricopeptide (TPR) repeat protein
VRLTTVIAANVIAIAMAIAGCAPTDALPDDASLLDEDVTLARAAGFDVARRELDIAGGSVVVAIVDEQLTDVSVSIADPNATQASLTVENNLRGAGMEITVLDVPQDSRIEITMLGPPESIAPGHAMLRVRRFAGSSQSPQLAAFRAWAAATNAAHRATAIRESGLADMESAIAALEGEHGDVRLAAEARLIKAHMLVHFQLDWRAARAEAQQAAQAFHVAKSPDPADVARARFVEALALTQIARDPASKDPAPDVAEKTARETLMDLSASSSPFGSIERARAIDAIAELDKNAALLDDANTRYEEAMVLYGAAGYTAGEREMRASLAHVFVERGRFNEAAKAFDAALPEIDQVSNPDRRVNAYISAGRAQQFSGRTDEATENLLKALALAREFELRMREASASQELGFVYWYRGDYLQAQAFLADALRLAREGKDDGMLATNLQSAGMILRIDGNYEAAIAMHKEGVERSTNPILRMRTTRHLALDYIAAGRYPDAIAELRDALATRLQDPKHHAYSDVKRDLAESLIEYGDGKPATQAEAAALLAETLEMCLKVEDRLGEIGAHRVKARLLAKQGKFGPAQKEFETAFNLIFAYRASSSNAQLRTQTLGHEQPAFRGYFDLMMRDVAARGPSAPRRATMLEERALRMLELARESHLGLVGAAPMNPAAAARVDALLSQMAEQSLTISALLKSNVAAKQTSGLDSLQLEMSRLRAEVDRERTAAVAEAATKQNSPSRVARTWRKVAPDAVQLSYALGNDHAYVWARRGDGTYVAVLSLPPAEIERELAGLAGLDAQTSPGKIEEAIARVSEVLLPTDLLPAQSKIVEVVAEGRLASVPFAGLRSPTNPARRLVETHAVTMITSLFAMPEAPRPNHARPFRLVALASGSGTLRSATPVLDPAPRLSAATAEIQAVARLFAADDPTARIKLFAGKDGSAEQLRKVWSSGADVVHFATHALADLRQPLASLLVLPAESAAGKPTHLTAGQVQDWRGDADLVFLSACESAIGPPRFAGGMPGLQSAFLRAGARGVIATLWPIEDVLARQFSEEFYERYTDGKSAVQALGETQRAWIARTQGASDADMARRRITALAHGFYTQ